MANDGSNRPRACPFYIVCDVSQSMWQETAEHEVTPYNVLSACVDQLLFKIEANPTVNEAAHISVMSFADETHTVLPLAKLENTQTIAALSKGNQTNYATVFAALRQAIEADCHALDRDFKLKQPTVFFLTDGGPYVGNGPQPESVWAPVRDRLVDESFAYRPHIVTFGFRSVSESTLCRVATSLGSEKLAFIANRALQVAELVESIMAALFISIGQSLARNELVIQPPAGMRRANGGRAGGFQ